MTRKKPEELEVVFEDGVDVESLKAYLDNRENSLEQDLLKFEEYRAGLTKSVQEEIQKLIDQVYINLPSSAQTRQIAAALLTSAVALGVVAISNRNDSSGLSETGQIQQNSTNITSVNPAANNSSLPFLGSKANEDLMRQAIQITALTFPGIDVTQIAQNLGSYFPQFMGSLFGVGGILNNAASGTYQTLSSIVSSATNVPGLPLKILNYIAQIPGPIQFVDAGELNMLMEEDLVNTSVDKGVVFRRGGQQPVDLSEYNEALKALNQDIELIESLKIDAIDHLVKAYGEKGDVLRLKAIYLKDLSQHNEALKAINEAMEANDKAVELGRPQIIKIFESPYAVMPHQDSVVHGQRRDILLLKTIYHKDLREFDKALETIDRAIFSMYTGYEPFSVEQLKQYLAKEHGERDDVLRLKAIYHKDLDELDEAKEGQQPPANTAPVNASAVVSKKAEKAIGDL